MSKGLEKLKRGDFNYMLVEPQDDDSIIITLVSREWAGIERFGVRDLYGPNEQELEVKGKKK